MERLDGLTPSQRRMHESLRTPVYRTNNEPGAVEQAMNSIAGMGTAASAAFALFSAPLAVIGITMYVANRE